MPRLAAFAVLCFTLGACAGGTLPRPATPPRDPVVLLEPHEPIASVTAPGEASRHTDGAPACPIGIPGLEVRASALRGGGELVFSAPPEHAEELRARVARLAQLHRESVSARARDELDRVTFGDETASFHRAAVSALATPDGARLIAVTSSREEVDALRAELRDDARTLEAGACPLALEIET